MVESPADLVDRLREIASTVDDPRAADVIASLQEHSRSPRLQVLVAGSTGTGRATFLNAILGRSLLPTSPLPKAPFPITLRHGTEAFETVAPDGSRNAQPLSRLRSLVLEPDRALVALEVRTPCDLLATCDLRIVTIDTGRSPEQWRDSLAGADVAILLLNATALLSHHERELIRQHLAAGFGLERVVIVVNQMDLVPTDEHDSILELVRAFLGPFATQPVIIPLSATELLAAGLDSPVGEELRILLADLVERHADLRHAALTAALDTAVAEIAAAAERQQALAAMTREEADALRQAIAEKAEWLASRVRRAQHRVDTFVGLLFKEQLQREIEGFGELFGRRLQTEIMEVEELAPIRQYLAGYIADVWKDFLQYRMIALQGKLRDEIGALGRLIASDLRDLLGDRADIFAALIGELTIGPDELHPFLTPRRGKHYAAGIAKGVSLYGYVMLFFSPPLGALSLGASHVIRRLNKAGIDRAEKDAVLEAALSASRELERELQTAIDRDLGDLTDRLKTEVATLYAEAVAAVETSLAETAARARDADARRATLHTLTRETIPALRRSVAEVGEVA